MHDLREILHQAAPRPRGQLNLEQAITRGHALAQRRLLAVALLSLAVCVAVWTVATSIPIAVSNKRSSPANPSFTERAGCSYKGQIREVSGASGTIVTDAPSSLVEIGLGEHQGTKWALCAYLRKVKGSRGGGRPEKADRFHEDHVCVGSAFGSTSLPSYQCANLKGGGASDLDLFVGASGFVENEGDVLYYGAISERVRRVFLRPSDGSERAAKLFTAPGKLGIEHNFFVAFAPSNLDVTVVVEDGRGRELDRHLWTTEP